MPQLNGYDPSRDLPPIEFGNAIAAQSEPAPMQLPELEKIAKLLQDSCDRIGVDLSFRFQHRRDSSKVTETALIQRLARIKDELASICEFAAHYEEGMISLDNMADAEAQQ